MIVVWALLMPDGSIFNGRATKPPPGWFSDVRRCLGLALSIHGYPPIYAVRPTCSNDVDAGLNAGGDQVELARFWGVKPEPGSEVWFWPDGSMVGFGRDTSEVQRLLLAFQGKLKANEVCRAADDQRGRAE